MALFYHQNPVDQPFLSKEESQHCVRVLRKKSGDTIYLIDGLGSKFEAVITNDSPKQCAFKIITKSSGEPRSYHIHVAMAPTKNHDRIEWFVEKACELGIQEISFISTKRAERKRINLDRLDKKAVSALKQSKNLFKTKINGLRRFEEVVSVYPEVDQKFIAYVSDENTHHLFQLLKPKGQYLILIGPEGDFTDEEVHAAASNGFQQIGLGDTVLRTETAGVVAAHAMKLINQ